MKRTNKPSHDKLPASLSREGLFTRRPAALLARIPLTNQSVYLFVVRGNSSTDYGTRAQITELEHEFCFRSQKEMALYEAHRVPLSVSYPQAEFRALG